MAGDLYGFPTAHYGYLIDDDRWPYLAATLDGLMFPFVGRDPEYDLTSQVGLASEVRSILDRVGSPVMCEVKVTDSGHRYKEKSGPHAGRYPWRDFQPEYHHEQVQTGLWMSGLEHGLLVGCLGGDDIIPWYIPRDPLWARILDDVNAEAERELGALWATTK